MRPPGRVRVSARLPTPPAALRRGPLRAGAFRSALHEPAVAARLGSALGVTFGVCFLTGLFSHYQQHPLSWFEAPVAPGWLFQLTQGLHVACGLASIPLLLAKLWVVYPRLWSWPPLPSLGAAVQRASVAVLVAAAGFQLVTGVNNIARHYPWRFGFTQTHFQVGIIAIGALIVHIGAQVGTARAHWRDPVPGVAGGRAARAGARGAAGLATTGPATTGLATTGLATAGLATTGLATTGLLPPPESVPAAADEDPPGAVGEVDRRALLVGVAAGVAAVTVATAGETVPLLAPVSRLAPRLPHVGPQGLPVNRSAAAAGVGVLATDPFYRLTVLGRDGRQMALGLADIAALPQRRVRLPIACVEGWSSTATWSGVAVRDLIALVGADPHSAVLVESLEPAGAYRTSVLGRQHTADPRSLLATHVHGAPLHLEHGFPLRLIAPDRPGVLQTKWVAAVRVL